MGSKGPRIAVLFHARERGVDPSVYLVHHLAEFWREQGLEVICLYRVDRFVPADLVLVHVDLSAAPADYPEFAARYPIGTSASPATYAVPVVVTTLIPKRSGDTRASAG